MKLLIINGANLNMLGVREVNKYGNRTLNDLIELCKIHAQARKVDVEFFNSNIEGEIIDAIHRAYNNCDGIIINPGGYTHTSVAILDALLAVRIPTIEVHLTNIFAREELRHESITARGCIGVIAGLNFTGYTMAIDALAEMI